MDQLKLHRTVIVDGVERLEKENVAQFVAARCGKVEKWWEDKSAAAASGTTTTAENNQDSSISDTIRLIFVFETINDLSVIAGINGMTFGEKQISCRLADTSKKSSTAILFESVLAITAGNNSDHSADTAKLCEESFIDPTIKNAQEMLKNLSQSAIFTQSGTTNASSFLFQNNNGLNNNNNNEDDDDLDRQLQAITCLEYPVSDSTVTNSHKHYVFLQNQASRQVRALVYLTNAFAREKRRELTTLKRAVNDISGAQIFGDDELKLLADDDNDDFSQFHHTHKKNHNKLKADAADGDSSSSDSDDSSSSSNSASSSVDRRKKDKKDKKDKKNKKSKKSKKEKKNKKSKKAKKEKKEKKHKK